MPGIDPNYFIRQAKKLSEKIEERRKQLAEETVEAKSGDGLVTVVLSCAPEVKSIKIDKKALDPNDPQLLEDLVIAAVNSALSQGRSHTEAELSKLSGGIKIPGVT